MAREPSFEDDELEDFIEDPAQTLAWGADNCIVVGLDCRSMNAYRFLRVRFPGIDHALLQRWLAEGKVRVNGSPVHSGMPLRQGDVVEIDADVTRPRQHSRPPTIEILHEDEAMMVVNKPAGLATAPERESRRVDLLTLLKERLAASGQTPKLVHRIDKHASGVVVFARDREAKRALVEEFGRRRVIKDYLALVSGELAKGPQLETAPLAVKVGRATTTVVDDHGKPSATLLRTVWRFRGYTAVHARPVTGRTHQIRVHLRHRGLPIVSDERYGGEKSLLLSSLKSDYRRGRGEQERPLLERLALHAFAIRLKSPATGKEVSCSAPLPKDLRTALRQLEKHATAENAERFEAFEAAPLGLDLGDAELCPLQEAARRGLTARPGPPVDPDG